MEIRHWIRQTVVLEAGSSAEDEAVLKLKDDFLKWFCRQDVSEKLPEQMVWAPTAPDGFNSPRNWTTSRRRGWSLSEVHVLHLQSISVLIDHVKGKLQVRIPSPCAAALLIWDLNHCSLDFPETFLFIETLYAMKYTAIPHFHLKRDFCLLKESFPLFHVGFLTGLCFP